MKIPPLVLVAGVVLLQSTGAHATGIRQVDYAYSFDDVARPNAHGPTFVICEGACAEAPPLAPAPRFPALSIRVSQGVAKESNSGTAQKVPVSGNGEITRGVDRGKGQQNPDAHVTVLFGFDSAVLNDAEKARLSSFVEGLDAETKTQDLLVTGFTCDLGRKAHNDLLAMDRAHAVAAYLRKSGLPAIRVAATGKCCYVAKDPDKRHLNRRVEVTTTKTEATR